ncbi:UNVERIFIED_ORG: hypothetical protein FHR68_003992 [Xanthomonas campestris]
MTYYVWTSKYSGMEASDVQRLRDVEIEHAKLKQMYAELAMESHALKDLIAKSCRPGAQASASCLARRAAWLELALCLFNGWRGSGVAHSTARYRRRPDRDEEVIVLLSALAERFPEHGFGELFQIIRCRGHVWNNRRVWHVHCLMKLSHCRRSRRRIPMRQSQPLACGDRPNAG